MFDSVLNPLIKKSLGSIIRAALLLLVPFFVSRDIWTTDEATATLTALATALATLGWSLYEKYHSQLKLNTALAMPTGSTQVDVEKKIKEGDAPPGNVVER